MTEIVDSKGRGIRKTGMNHIVVYTSPDLKNWRPVPVPDVPEWLKDHNVMGSMVAGEAVSKDDGGPYYCAAVVWDMIH